MDTAFTEEQDEIRRTVREVLAKRCRPDAVKAAAGTPAGHDAELWSTLSQQLGLPGLALPGTYGGAGCGTAELALVFEETGRALLPSPLLATAVLSAPLISALGTEEQHAALLPALASGGTTSALAVPAGTLPLALGLTGAPGTESGAEGSTAAARGGGTGNGWAGGGRSGGMQAYRANGGTADWRLYGESGQVLDGHSAELLLVAAHTGGFARSRTLLFLVRADAPGLVRKRQTALDETRPVARLELRDVPAELLGASEDEDVRAALARVGPRAGAVLAAEAAGAADGALARTVEYVKAREQFGRPIGSFQAVQHRLADVYVQVQAARSAAYYAAWAADSDAHEAATAGGLALAQALEALRLAAGEAVQLHGGIGFTWEHEAHLYFKRAAGDDLLFGPVHRLRAHAADRAALFAPHTAPVPESRTGRGPDDGPPARDGHTERSAHNGHGERKAAKV